MSVSADQQAPPIVLVPIVEEDILTVIGEGLKEAFGRACVLAAPLPHPDYAYDGRRGQYLADAILARLRTLGLNFVFGQAMAGGRDAVVALPRLRQEFYGLPEDEVLFKERAIKEAVHELGHTYGLGHCPNSRCVMHFSNSLADTDIKGASFCRTCRGELDEAGL